MVRWPRLYGAAPGMECYEMLGAYAWRSDFEEEDGAAGVPGRTLGCGEGSGGVYSEYR